MSEGLKGCKLKFAWLCHGLLIAGSGPAKSPAYMYVYMWILCVCKVWAHGGCGGSWKSSWETNRELLCLPRKDTMQRLSCIYCWIESVYGAPWCATAALDLWAVQTCPQRKTQVPVPISAGVNNSKTPNPSEKLHKCPFFSRTHSILYIPQQQQNTRRYIYFISIL
jgi:hypothetical protein